MVARVRAVAGTLLVGVGVIGTVLPVIPGIPFLVAGMVVLGPDHALTRAVARRLRAWRGRRGGPAS